MVRVMTAAAARLAKAAPQDYLMLCVSKELAPVTESQNRRSGEIRAESLREPKSFDAIVDAGQRCVAGAKYGIR